MEQKYRKKLKKKKNKLQQHKPKRYTINGFAYNTGENGELVLS